ncbi:MAG: hypothetical protein PHN32_00390 [Actinomycetota bacterium]|nr:hypothetical protein [Actinomycetota bacterium]
MKPRYKNPLILSIVSTVFLIPIMIMAMYLFNTVNWAMLAVTVAVYFVVIFLIYLYYGGIGRK